MNAPTSERDAVLRERAAFLKGRKNRPLCVNAGPDCPSCVREAADTFPLPKVTRVRIVRDSAVFGLHHEFAVIGGEVRERRVEADNMKFDWREPSGWLLNAAVIGVWADLLANPLEIVEAEA